MFRISACVMATVFLLAGTAFGQQKAPPQPPPGLPPKTQSQIAADKAADRAYQSSLKNIPDQPAADPWGGARSIDPPKAAAKAKSGTKAPAN